jgi:dihydrofolate reductase
MKNISIIVAIAENNAIGRNNQLLWHISADLRRFKEITLGHPVIMGKNTWFSLPVRPLKNRKNIVITDNPDDRFEGAVTVYSIAEALERCDDKDEYFIIGGASVYRQFLPYANKLYLTLVEKAFEADTFFPPIPDTEWETLSSEQPVKDPDHDFTYRFVTLKRKN